VNLYGLLLAIFWTIGGDQTKKTVLNLYPNQIPQASTPDEQHWAALFAGAIEQLCTEDSLVIPSWVTEPQYYLQEPWYPTARKEKLRQIMEEVTPNSFKQRKVFVGDNALVRV